MTLTLSLTLTRTLTLSLTLTPTLTLKLFGGAAFLVTGLDDDEEKATLLTLLKARTVTQS